VPTSGSPILTPVEPVFAEPWEAQAFALAVKLHEAGLFTWTEWSEALAAEIKDTGAPYYQAWLAALEKLVERKHLISPAERTQRIEDWDRAARATPHGEPIVLNRAERAPGTPREANTTAPGGLPSGTSPR
jgi:nitrile hydratase accessory protein